MSNKTAGVDAAIADLGNRARDHAATGDAAGRDRVAADFRKRLDDLIDGGWTGALGAANELPDDQLPQRYLDQRAKVMEDLEIQLANCAARYRGAPAGSKEDADAIAEYHRVFDELLRVAGKPVGLDPDAELPDDLMPKVYVDYWL